MIVLFARKSHNDTIGKTVRCSVELKSILNLKPLQPSHSAEIGSKAAFLAGTYLQ